MSVRRLRVVWMNHQHRGVPRQPPSREDVIHPSRDPPRDARASVGEGLALPIHCPWWDRTDLIAFRFWLRTHLRYDVCPPKDLVHTKENNPAMVAFDVATASWPRATDLLSSAVGNRRDLPNFSKQWGSPSSRSTGPCFRPFSLIRWSIESLVECISSAAESIQIKAVYPVSGLALYASTRPLAHSIAF